MKIKIEYCPCGKPLHYDSPKTKHYVDKLNKKHGEMQIVELQLVKRTYMVPRHYIALHGLNTETLPDIAKDLGFEEVISD